MSDFSADGRPAQPAHAPAGGYGPRGDEQLHPTGDLPPAAPPPSAPGAGQRLASVVKGRIEVADEVVEKVAGLAAIDVEGVADLGGDLERALESVRGRIGIGNKRGDQGVRADINGREVAVSVTIVVQYGHVVMEVARRVQSNVAVQTNRMLGLTVVEVNVTVDDVKLPEGPKSEDDRGYDSYEVPGDAYA